LLILTAQALNSGILALGSRAGFVSLFAGASAKWNGIKTIPFLILESTNASAII